MLDALMPLDGQRLLEVGCGAGLFLHSAAAAGAIVWGVDESISRLERARRRVPDADLRLGSPDELPFDSGMFDVVCSFAVAGCDTVEHAIRELARVCRPGGVVAIVVDRSLPTSAITAILDWWADGLPRQPLLAGRLSWARSGPHSIVP